MVRIAIIGCGLMGIKIAGCLAFHGHHVRMYDELEKVLNNVHRRLEDDKEDLRKCGILTTETFVGKILCFRVLKDCLNGVEFVIECIAENLSQKQQLFEDIASYCSPDTIIFTNTLRLDVTTIACNIKNQSRAVGLRFLYPVYMVPEVEITPGKHTSGTTIAKVRKLIENLGKTLFFRSGSEPLILTEEERDQRRQDYINRMHNGKNLGLSMSSPLPSLSNKNSPESPEVDVLQTFIEADQHKDDDCAICMDRSRNCVLSPCHHLVTCTECAAMLLNRHDGCPICRKNITKVIRVYNS